MNKEAINKAVIAAFDLAIRDKVSDKAVKAAEKCTALLELFYVEYIPYKAEIKNLKLNFSDIEKHIKITGMLNQGQKAQLVKSAANHVKQINNTIDQLERLLNSQFKIVDRLSDERANQIAELSEVIIETKVREAECIINNTSLSDYEKFFKLKQL